MKTVFQDIAWSPDGKYLYFSAIYVKKNWSDFSKSKWSVYQIRPDGSDLKRLSTSSVWVSVSPDGQIIATTKTSAKEGSITLLSKTGENDPVLSNTWPGTSPSWSPDGSEIVYTYDKDSLHEVHIAKKDGRQSRRITFSKGSRPYNPSFSNDGKHILYHDDRGDRRDQIYIVPVSGGTFRNITADTSHNIFPGWTPDGRIIFCRIQNEKKSIVITDIDRKNEYVIPNVTSFFARISPDGKVLAFINDRGIFISKTNGTDIQFVIDKLQPQ